MEMYLLSFLYPKEVTKTTNKAALKNFKYEGYSKTTSLQYSMRVEYGHHEDFSLSFQTEVEDVLH